MNGAQRSRTRSRHQQPFLNNGRVSHTALPVGRRPHLTWLPEKKKAALWLSSPPGWFLIYYKKEGRKRKLLAQSLTVFSTSHLSTELIVLNLHKHQSFCQLHRQGNLCMQAGISGNMCECVHTCIFTLHTAYVHVPGYMCTHVIVHVCSVMHVHSSHANLCVLASVHQHIMYVVYVVI